MEVSEETIPASAPDHRQQRRRRVTASAVTGIASRLSNALVQVLSVAITVRYLGSERYGLWVNLVVLSAWTTLANFGLGAGLVTQLSHCDGRGDREGAARILSSTFAAITAITIALLLVFGVVWMLTPWPSVFHVTTKQAIEEAGPAVLISVGLAICTLPLRIAEPVLNGNQRGYVANLWSLAGSVAGLLGLLLGVFLQVGIPMLLALVIIPQILLCNVAGWLHAWRLGLMPLSRRLVDRQAAWNCLRFGGGYFLIQVFILVGQSMTLIVANVEGAESVTPYAVTQRLAFLVITLVNTAAAPLWPAFGEAATRGDVAWVRSTFRKGLGLTLIMGLMMVLTFAISGKWIIRLWAGPAAIPSTLLLGLLLVYALVQSLLTVTTMLLQGLGRLKPLLMAGGAATLVTVVGGYIMCRYMGQTGAALAQTLAVGVINLPPLLYAAQTSIERLSSRSTSA